MCGRYSLTTPVEALRQLFRFENSPNLPPRYNIVPTQTAPVVRISPAHGGRELALLRWGLVPPWSEGPDSGYSMINARAETVATKPAFRAAFRRRRCLVPASGFNEWRKDTMPKQPYHIHRRDGEPMASAGLSEHWEGRDGAEPIKSFTFVVTDANATVRPLHDRMPVVLAPEDSELWLQGPLEKVQALLRSAPEDWLEAYPVSRRVNRLVNADSGLIEPIVVG